MYILCDYYVFMAKSYKHILWKDFHVSKENHKGSLVNTSRTQMLSTCSNVSQFQGSNTCHDDRAKIIPGSNCKRNLHAAKWPLPAAKLTTAKPASLAETIFEKLSKWLSTTLPTKIADDLCHFSMIPEKRAIFQWFQRNPDLQTCAEEMLKWTKTKRITRHTRHLPAAQWKQLQPLWSQALSTSSTGKACNASRGKACPKDSIYEHY